MNWIFTYSGKRDELIQRLLQPPRVRILAHVLQGSTLWTVEQTTKDPYIVCYLIGRDPNVGWGYCALRETDATPCNCPVHLLDLAWPLCPKWRERVRLYDSEHRKTPAVGETWALKQARIPHVVICQTHPRLRGVYAGTCYSIRPTQLGKRLRPCPQTLVASSPKGTP